MKFKNFLLRDISLNGKGEYGIGASAVSYNANLPKYLRITDINLDGTLKYEDMKSVNDINSKKYFLSENDIVFARTGNSTGKNYFYDISDGELVYAGFLIKFSLDPSKVVPKFIKYYCMSSRYWAWINGFSTGSTRANINAKTYGELPLILPNLSYQQKSVRILEKFDKKIKLNNQMIDTLEEIASTLFKRWFVDFEFPDENGNPYKSSGGKMIDSELGEIPKGFTVNKLNEVVEVKYGKDHKKLSEGIYPVYGSGGLMRVVDKYLYTGESVLIPRKGSLNNIMYVNESFWTVDTMFFTKMKMDNVAKYVFLTLIRIDFSSMNVGSAVPSMTTAILNDLSIVIPSNNVLNDFDYHISTLFQQKKSLEIENKKLSALRDTLLPKILSGEIEL